MGTVAVVSAVFGAAAGSGAALLIDRTGSDADEAAAQPPAGLVSVEVNSAVAEAAVRARESVVRIESRSRTSSGVDVGSGVVIDGEGHIVTNAHVVLGTDSLRIFLADGSEQQAILIGHDSPFTDVAVLQIAPGAAPALEAGDAAAVQLGETVVAVGNPLSEFAGSVSVGVISGLARVRTLDGMRYDDLLQTDAALNNGNSGGALVNLAGQFIGMPTAVLREAGNGQPVAGIGFAIPSNRVMEVARAIIEDGGPIDRASLGVEHLDLGPGVGRVAGIAPETQGALIVSVRGGGPADEAGLRPGDVITSLAGVPVDREHPLLNALAGLDPGDVVDVTFDRSGRITETRIQLGRR
jgi:2-alkenal reductase